MTNYSELVKAAIRKAHEDAAAAVGVHIATIYRELERGKIIVADSVRYSADTAQRAIG